MVPTCVRGDFAPTECPPKAQGAPPCLLTVISCSTKKSTDDKSGKANVAAHAGSVVWGVLCTIADGDLDKLDKGEGGYRKVRLSLRLTDNTSTDAWVYVAKKPQNDPGSLRHSLIHRSGRELIYGARPRIGCAIR